jgi:transposase
MNRDLFWLTDEQFSKIAPHLPTDTRGKARVDDRRVISGIVHVLKSGGRWVDAPPDYGPKKTLYNRFVRWAAACLRRASRAIANRARSAASVESAFSMRAISARASEPPLSASR